MDILKELGALSLASRLKRLSELLTKDVTNVYTDLNIDFEARWFTFIYTLWQNKTMSVTELAHSLSISHTAVKQLAEEIIKKGYITSAKSAKDERLRLITVSKKGEALIKKLLPIWQKIEAANKDLIDIAVPGFLNSISVIEDELSKMSMYERVFMHINGALPSKIAIHEYSPRMKKYFRQLNYEWLEEYFEIEEKDKKILSNPKNIIINNGGAILFAEMDNAIVGTCAIIKHSNGVFELAKMAVTQKYRSRGIGLKLLEAALSSAKQSGAAELYLLTNKSLLAANALYKKSGFTKTDINPFEDYGYKRETYAMKYSFKKSKKS